MTTLKSTSNIFEKTNQLYESLINFYQKLKNSKSTKIDSNPSNIKTEKLEIICLKNANCEFENGNIISGIEYLEQTLNAYRVSKSNRPRNREKFFNTFFESLGKSYTILDENNDDEFSQCLDRLKKLENKIIYSFS